MKNTTRSIVLFFILTYASVATTNGDEIAVIINSQSLLGNITKAQLIQIYTGKLVDLPNNITPIPLDVSDTNLHATFYKDITGMSIASLNSYWARLIFSGVASPPRKMPNEQVVLHTIEVNLSTIGFVWFKTIVSNSKVKIVIILP